MLSDTSLLDTSKLTLRFVLKRKKKPGMSGDKGQNFRYELGTKFQPSSWAGGGGAAGREMKGYKKTADGRVTTYFNNDLTEEAKALIGDIAPKRLDAGGGGDAGGEEAAGSDVSVWNKAGTWESRDMTRFGKISCRK